MLVTQADPENLTAIVAAAGTIRELVLLLGPRNTPDVQYGAAGCLMCFSDFEDFRNRIADDGGIPMLVVLLAPLPPGEAARAQLQATARLGGSRAEVQMSATVILCDLTLNDNLAAGLVAAGVIGPLVALLASGVIEETQCEAAGALMGLVLAGDNSVVIAAAGAIPPLVALLRPACQPDVQHRASGALGRLAVNADNAATIAGAGVIPALVALLSPGTRARMWAPRLAGSRAPASPTQSLRAAPSRRSCG
ncbi:hypothetical protein FOA52_007445 [Chlamydomonas sp. UWO 241]|nr:hypothetical protein FOA52_007445 [Chlamydomonas sp. UWO 241]